MRLVTVLIATALAAPIVSVLGADAGRAAVQRPFPLVSVSGEGRASVKPDIARATAGVSTDGKTPREAADANARAMSAVVAAARQAGIADGDIRTARFSMQPVQATRGREGGPHLVGYRVSNQVEVKIRDASKIGEVLDQLIGAGATNIAGVEFVASDSSKPLDEARAAAFADAKRKAELYARAAGAQIGRAVSIAEQGADSPPYVVYRSATAPSAPPTPIAPGEEIVRVQITVTFELLQ